MPTPAEKPSATSTISGETTVLQPVNRASSAAPPNPIPTPMRPPTRLITMLSTRNWVSTSPPRAPMAMRMPISRVRSVTETSMMFMIPMPPTSRLTEAMAASRIDITWVVPCAVSAMSVWLRTSKSSSSHAARSWLSRRIAAISAWASGRSPGDEVEARIWPMKLHPLSRVWAVVKGTMTTSS